MGNPPALPERLPKFDSSGVIGRGVEGNAIDGARNDSDGERVLNSSLRARFGVVSDGDTDPFEGARNELE